MSSREILNNIMHTADPTKRLPAELLVMIFLAWKHLHGLNQYGPVAEWVRTTWVCKTWREVALEAAELWSSVIIWRQLADDPALEVQLDRAHGAPLDMLVSCPRIPNDEDLEEIFRFVLSKTKTIKRLRIGCYSEQRTIVERLIKDVGSELESLSVSLNRGNAVSCEWSFSPDALPRLRHLTLSHIVPMASAPLPSLVHLSLTSAYDLLQLRDYLTEDETLILRTRIHRFLAACPNLETLRLNMCFAYPADYNVNEQPVIPLPKLRHLSLKDSVFEITNTLGSLRLHPSASLHILSNDLTVGSVRNGDYVVHILPRNLSQSLAPVQHTRRLALTIGHPTTHLSLRGTQDRTFDSEDQDRDGQGNWSITLPNLSFDASHPIFVQGYPGDPFLRRLVEDPDPERAKFYYLGLAACRFLVHVPHLVVPARLVELQLHFARGLLVVARNGADADSYWARFFATMPHLRTLGIGGGAVLVEAVLKALNAHPAFLCGELRDLALCSPTTVRCGEENEKDAHAVTVFLREVVAGWVRERARAGTPLRSLAVRISSSSNENADGSRMHARDGGGGGRLGNSDGEAVSFGAELREDLLFLEDSVGEVVVETTDCGACCMEYELPVDPDEEDAGRDDDGDGAYFY
ncbi:hypothetical protein V8D89_007023 [Ganoderma adspersum]